MGPASLLGWMAYTNLPSLTFYYDGWKDLPKIGYLEEKVKNEKEA